MPVTAERFLTVDEVASEFRVSKRTVYRAVERRELPSIRLGARIRIPVAALEDLLRPARVVRNDEEDA